MSSESVPIIGPIGLPAESERRWFEKLHELVITVDHKKLGAMYICLALSFLVIGGIEAAIMRFQLVIPHASFVSPQVFNRMFTMHGTTMIFFAAMPVLFGFGIYLVPLMIGTRDMAFPRLNAWGFWMSALGGLLLYFSFVGGDGLYGRAELPMSAGGRMRRLLPQRFRGDTARTIGPSRCLSQAWGRSPQESILLPLSSRCAAPG